MDMIVALLAWLTIFFGLPTFIYVVHVRCAHDWQEKQVVKNHVDDNLMSIVYIHECKKCKKIKRQKVEVC